MTTQPGHAAAAGPAAAMGRAGLIAIGVSVAVTFAVAVAGPSVMEPALPGRAPAPPWSLGLHPSAYLVVPLTAAGLAAGTLGLVLVLRAARGGWLVPARTLLVAGLLAAAALTLVPPIGSSDHLSYAAYGRILVTGHNPYATTPAQLAALGDPIARAVQDWSGTPSVYGPLATAIEALASLVGGNSVRLTVFMLGLANLAAFGVTGLLLHRMTRADPARLARESREIEGIAVTALLGVLLSPVSWIHHFVVVVVTIGAILADGRSRRRVAIATGTAVFFAMTIPWWGQSLLGRPDVPALAARVVEDAFGIAALGLVVILARRRAPACCWHHVGYALCLSGTRGHLFRGGAARRRPRGRAAFLPDDPGRPRLRARRHGGPGRRADRELGRGSGHRDP